MIKDYMKALTALRQRTRSAGFTMIELLIVIAILGILAVALLSAINPVEQINRGRDTGSRSDAEQLLSAIDRFQAFQGFYPWTLGAGDPFDVDVTQVRTTWEVTGLAGCGILDRLGSQDPGLAGCVNTDELKLSFIQRIDENSYNHLYIYNSGDIGASTYVCFEPQSSAFRQEATTRCQNGLPNDISVVADQVCPGIGSYASGPNMAGNTDIPMVCLP